MVIAVDSSGFKVTNREEWMRRKKKGYVKLHIAVDVKTKQVIAFDVTDERTYDNKKLQILVKKAGKKANIKKDALYRKKETGYGKRAIAENFFSVFKRLFGEAVMAKRWERIVKEIQLMIFFYNLIIAMKGKRTYKSLT